MQVINRETAVRMIEESRGKIITVIFRKRTDNTLRKMNCRTDVTKGVKGVGNGIDKKKHKLSTVYDMQAKGFRSISHEGIINLKIAGQEYFVQ